MGQSPASLGGTTDEVEFFDESFLDNFDEFQEKLAAQEYEDNKRELYQQSLDRLTNRDGTLFDYMSGKIAIDESDKYEIDQKLRANRQAEKEKKPIPHESAGKITPTMSLYKDHLKKFGIELDVARFDWR